MPKISCNISKLYVENQSYELKKGDVLIIPPDKLHRPVIEDNIPYERYVLWIYNSCLTRNVGINGFIRSINSLADEKKTHRVSFAGKEYDRLRGLLDKALDSFISEEAFSEYVTESCGFFTYSNFYKAFVERTGVAPRDYDHSVCRKRTPASPVSPV